MRRSPADTTSPLRVTSHLLLLVTMLLGFLVITAAPAAADPSDPDCWVDSPEGGLIYICTDEEPGEPGDPGDGGEGDGGEPTCDLSRVADWHGNVEFCKGEEACKGNFPSLAYPNPEDWPEPRPEDPNAIYVFISCTDGSNSWEYYIPDVPPLEQQAWQAYGELFVPDFTLSFSPPQRTLVNIDTWWWAEGVDDSDLIGESAFTVVAIATPSHIEVDPGDGTGVKECPWSTEASDACMHQFRRSSVSGGASANGVPAYASTARLVYDVRFENNGAPLVLPGLPTRLEGLWEETAVPVAEVQAIVSAR